MLVPIENNRFKMQQFQHNEQLPPTFLEKVNAIIKEQLHEETFGVERLQKDLLISYPHMYRKIKELTGLSPSLFIRQLRLKRAASLLQKSELHIGEIAYRVGFNTPNYFTTCFVEFYNCTPSAFRGRENSLAI